jgi:hypothetical protein
VKVSGFSYFHYKKLRMPNPEVELPKSVKKNLQGEEIGRDRF